MNKELYDLTNPQKSIWLTEQYYKGSSINNIVAFLQLDDNPNIEALKKAFNILLKNNDSFRTRITLVENIPMQYFENFEPLSIDTLLIKNQTEYNEFKNSFSTQPLNILDSQLFNVKILDLPDNKIILALSVHHIIGDAWTISLALEEELKYYYQCINSEFNDNPRPSYKIFINNQNEYLNSDKYSKDKEFWQEYFNCSPSVLSLKKNSSISTHSERSVFTLSDSITEKMNTFCKKNKISDYIFLLSVFSIYFRNIYNSDKFIIGNPVLNRANFIEKQTTGAFISTMPFYINIEESGSFLALCNKISADQKQIYRHLRYPFHEILNYVREKFSMSGELFDIVFSYQNSPVPSYAKWIPNHCQAESLQIHIKNLSTEKNSDLSIHYDYLTDVFTESEILSIQNRIEYMILQILNSDEILINSIESIVNDEFAQINGFNSTSAEYNRDSNISKEFENMVSLYPDQTAIIDDFSSLSYIELNQKANYLANIIISKNINSEIISFALPRSSDIYVSILAILKSGNTYMPIDTEYPIDRINFMLQNSGSKILITTKDFSQNIKFKEDIVFFEDLLFDKDFANPVVPISSDDYAYIMYTSGSTGIPKAVTIRHYNVLNFVKSMQSYFDYIQSKNNRILSVTTVCFDIFVFETFPTLLSGLTIVLATELESKSPELLSKLITKYKISKLLTTPSRIDLLLDTGKNADCLAYIKEFLLGGEPVSKTLVDNIKKYSTGKIYDLYGPTETTVYSTFKDVTNSDYITIGKPINNTHVYILNDFNKMLPINTIGEICISGDGVGAGYYNNPQKTSLSFIKCNYSSDTIYKTGDLGMWNSDGELICYGRKDNQVKIRGYRIELDDIVNNIQHFKDIEKCIVSIKLDKNDRKYLCAYFISKRKINTTKLKKYLVNLLPNYMIPNYLIQLQEFPLTLNHKIDKNRLPDPLTISKQEHKYVAPKTTLEKNLCSVACDVLNIDKISINCDLFDFNIDSLDIIKIQTKLLCFNIKINTQEFYQYRTIKELSKHINMLSNSKSQVQTNASLIHVNDTFIRHSSSPCIRLQNTYSTILLTGATGYLGIHVLRELLKTSVHKIICTVRQKSTIITAEKRLMDIYKFYFDEELPMSRILVISSDITGPFLGLSQFDYNNIFKEVDLIINIAANVRYYGNYSDFKKTNIDVVDNLIKLSIANNAQLVHISTMGLVGNYLISNSGVSKSFSEDDFYIGQNFNENIYIKTKSEAEALIYEKSKGNLKACIIRVGNLTGRYSDGHFQKNIDENAFYNILRVILRYKIIPETALEEYLEFTPVDFCATAISELIFNYTIKKRTFHLFNNNYILLKDLLNIFKDLGYFITTLPGIDFKNEIINIENSHPSENIIKGIINELDDKNGITISSNIQQMNSITNNYLCKLGFHWPNITKVYIEYLINYMNRNNYL